MDDPLSDVFEHGGSVAALVALLLLASAEAGYRLGRRLFERADAARRSQIAEVQASILGLLALLLGFTFSMALDRYDDRRTLVVQEANAIGTAWLRAGLLSPEHRTAIRRALREYLELRLRSPEALRQPELMVEGLRETGHLHAAMWRRAEGAASEVRDDITAMAIESLNAVIDTHAERVAAFRAGIPPTVWLLLLVTAAAGTWVTAYAAGADGVRSPLTNVLMPLLAGFVILLIVDLVNERRGLIGTSQQPLIDLHGTLDAGRRADDSLAAP